MALFETTASAPDAARASLAPRSIDNNCACFAYVIRASDERTEQEAETKAEPVDSKRAYCVIQALRFKHTQSSCLSKTVNL